MSYDPECPPGEIQSDVVFREGQTLGGHVTYTPRLIAMDLKGTGDPSPVGGACSVLTVPLSVFTGSLRTLRQEGGLYDAGRDAAAVTW